MNPHTHMYTGERQYFLVQLLTAVTFIDGLGDKSVTMDPAVFAAQLKIYVYLCVHVNIYMYIYVYKYIHTNMSIHIYTLKYAYT